MEERVGGGKRSARGKGKENVKVNEEEEEAETSPPSFDWIPPEVVLKVLSQLDGKTLMIVVPQVIGAMPSATAACNSTSLATLNVAHFRAAMTATQTSCVSIRFAIVKRAEAVGAVLLAQAIFDST